MLVISHRAAIVLVGSSIFVRLSLPFMVDDATQTTPQTNQHNGKTLNAKYSGTRHAKLKYLRGVGLSGSYRRDIWVALHKLVGCLLLAPRMSR